MPKSFRTPRRHAAALLLFSVGATAACGDKPAAGEGPYADLVAEYVPKIEAEMGLPFKTPPKVEKRSRDEVATFVRKQLESERGKQQVTGQEAAYKLLGMVPDTMQLAVLLQLAELRHLTIQHHLMELLHLIIV
jgi:hypothetical protein